jgi:3-oxoacyl-[acyl-carrier-protein] synthase II
MPLPRRVAVTGLGPISAFGVGIDALWGGLASGRTAIAPIGAFDASGFRCRHAAELPRELFDPRSAMPKTYRKHAKVMSRDIELAIGAAAAAVADAGLATRGSDPDAPPTIPSERVGCHIGAGLIAAEIDELTAALAKSCGADGEFDLGAWGESGMGHLSPLWMLKYLPNMLACHVTIIHGCEGPSNTITCAEASSGLSLGESMRVIGRGDADACLSGGAESKVNPMGLLRQQFAGRLAESREGCDPAALVRPFSPDANGTVLGEGGGILVLEAMEIAAARNASVKAELAGFGAAHAASLDAAGLVLDPAGEAVAAAVDAALADAGIPAARVGAVAPLGSGIPGIDELERAGLRRIFGERLAALPMLLPIPAVGNCTAGAGALAAALSAKCLVEQRLPARINGGAPEGVAAHAEPGGGADLEAVVSVIAGLGGQVAAIVLRRAPR